MYREKYIDINNCNMFEISDTIKIIPSDSSLFAASMRNGSLVDYISSIKNNYTDPQSTIPIFILGSDVSHKDVLALKIPSDDEIYDDVLKALGAADVNTIRNMAWSQLGKRLNQYKSVIPDKITDIDDLINIYNNINNQISTFGLTVMDSLGLMHAVSQGRICYGYISDNKLEVGVAKDKVWINYSNIFYASNNKYSLEKYIDLLCGDMKLKSEYTKKDDSRRLIITASQSKVLEESDVIMFKKYKVATTSDIIKIYDRINIADYGVNLGKILNIFNIMDNKKEIWLKHKDLAQWMKWLSYIPTVSPADTQFVYRNVDRFLPNRLLTDKSAFTIINNSEVAALPSIMIDRNTKDKDLVSLQQLASILRWARVISIVCTLTGCITSFFNLFKKESKKEATSEIQDPNISGSGDKPIGGVI